MFKHFQSNEVMKCSRIQKSSQSKLKYGNRDFTFFSGKNPTDMEPMKKIVLIYLQRNLVSQERQGIKG